MSAALKFSLQELCDVSGLCPRTVGPAAAPYAAGKRGRVKEYDMAAAELDTGRIEEPDDAELTALVLFRSAVAALPSPMPTAAPVGPEPQAKKCRRCAGSGKVPGGPNPELAALIRGSVAHVERAALKFLDEHPEFALVACDRCDGSGVHVTLPPSASTQQLQAPDRVADTCVRVGGKAFGFDEIRLIESRLAKWAASSADGRLDCELLAAYYAGPTAGDWHVLDAHHCDRAAKKLRRLHEAWRATADTQPQTENNQ